MPKIPTNEEFDEKLRKAHGEKYKRMENRMPNQTNIKMFCVSCNLEWYPRIGHLLKGFGCPNCRKIKMEDFDKRVETIFKGKYIRIGEYNLGWVARKKIKMKCLVCNNEQQQLAHHILEGHGCWKCMRTNLIDNQRITIEEFISRSKEINGNHKYDYSLIDKIENQKHKITLICNVHGKFNQSVSDHLYNKSGCPKCRESKGEKQIRIYLENNNIAYEIRKKFKGCCYKKPLYFDFYLPNHNMCIEYDGEQHFTGMRRINKKTFTPEETETQLKIYKIRDEIKNEYCISNNIRLLRIDYKNFNNIEQILNTIFLES